LGDSAAIHLSNAIQIKTISKGDTLPIDTAEFVAFRLFLEKSYPLVHQQLTRQIFNQFSYLYTWKGKDTTLAPYVLMAHMDVVPVEAIAEKNWSVPSFSGAIKNDTIWGRGAVDDKVAVIAILESVENLLKQGYTPSRNIYISLGHDEEVSGKRGAKVISAWFKEQGIKPALVLDEGGQIDLQHFKSIQRPVAVVATGEKGYMNIDLSVEIPGGHSSMPTNETAIDVLNKAILQIRAKKMPAEMIEPVRELVHRTSAYESFFTRMVTNNLWLTKKLVISQLEKTKESNAMVHTTLVPTIVQAGIKDNVIPTIARATFNSRILPGQTSDEIVQFIKEAVNDERVVIKKQTISLMEPSSFTPHTHPAFLQIENIIRKSVPKVVVSPFLMIGATDSRYFRSFSDAVLNFSAVQDVKGFHGIDERIGITDLHRMIYFYQQLIQGK
jgi:carboxypeptidase PM20D1